MTTKFTFSAAIVAAALTLGVVGLPQTAFATAGWGVGIGGQDASGDAQAKLKKSQFKDVKVSVDNGIATLTGTRQPLRVQERRSQSRPQGKGRECGA